MTIADIIKIESDREGKANVVHLIKDGNFYHANDWSAWLMTKFPIGEAATKPMRVTVNSYLGIMQHTASYNQRRRLFMRKELLQIGRFNDDMTKFELSKPRSIKWAKCEPS